jgi:secreted PhoX family phosphatase
MSKATTEPGSLWHELLEKKINRRGLMKGVMIAGAVTAAAPIQLRNAEAATIDTPAGLPGMPRDPSLSFSPIKPSTQDAVVLPNGYRQNVLAIWGDDIGAGKVGFNHDWIGYFPVDGLDKGFDSNAVAYGFLKPTMSSTDGFLVINHEYVNPMFVSEYAGEGEKTQEQIAKEQDAVGLSVVRVTRDAETGEWKTVDDALNRRVTALTPMQLSGPAADIDEGPEVIGTLANCSGGVTPWGTALSCEENFQDYPAEAPAGYGWDPDVYGKRHYGWVVEIDPYDPDSMPRKHTALGRFRHENVAIRVGQDGTVVAYLGDDRADSCVYKFVADQKFDPAADRETNLKILEAGKLYVADFQNGAWLPLDYESSDALKEAKDADDKPVFTSQADVLADARAAAMAVRGTPVDRPEDIEIHPKDGSVYVALTNNTGHGNFHGQIVRLAETDGNPAAETFDWSIFAVGGSQSGFSSPDNLVFDGDGNMWMVTDVSSSRVGKGIYAFQGNNGMFFFRTGGPYAGIAYQFASGPNEAEMTGPAWTPDGRTLFLSVQHPGEESNSMEELSSHWPKGGSELPRPAVVAIQGFRARRT